MTTFLLVRHGHTDWIGKGFAGRLPGVSINAEGRAQAERLADNLAGRQIAAIYSSPLERAQQTATPLAARLGLAIEIRPRLIEVGLGDWNGRTFDEIGGNPEWRRYNSFRSSTRPEGGELMTDIASRMVDEMEELRLRHADETIVLVSHGDVIKVAVAHYTGVPIDLMQRIEISPASVSIIELADWGPKILCVNDTRATTP